MRVRKIIIIIVSFVIFSNIAIAVENIMYFDVQKVVALSKAGKSVKSQIEKINKSNTTEFNKIEDKLKKDEKALVAKKNVLSKEDFQKELNKLKVDIEKYKQTRNMKINETSIKGMDATKKILTLLTPILGKYAQENNITLVLDKKNVIIGRSEQDATDTILTIIDKEIKVFSIK